MQTAILSQVIPGDQDSPVMKNKFETGVSSEDNLFPHEALWKAVFLLAPGNKQVLEVRQEPCLPYCPLVDPSFSFLSKPTENPSASCLLTTHLPNQHLLIP